MEADKFYAYAKNRANELRKEAREKEIEAGTWDAAAAAFTQITTDKMLCDKMP